MDTSSASPGRDCPATAPPDTPTGVGTLTEPVGGRSPAVVFAEELARLLDVVFDADRQIAAATAARAVAIDAARVHNERTDCGVSALSPGLARRSLVGELSCGLRLPTPTAENLLAESKALVHTLPDTLTALTTGQAGYRQAQILVEETYGLTVDVARHLERAVLPAAGRLSPSQFNRKVRTTRERLDPDSITARHHRSIADRSLTFTPAPDGMCWLNAYLAAADGIAIHNRVTGLAMALQGPGEQRTLTQRRPDVFRDLILDPAPTTTSNTTSATSTGSTGTGTGGTMAAPASTGGGAAGRREPGAGSDRFRGSKPDLIITVPVLTLLGVTEQPGTLDGYGPIDPDTARDLASRCPSAIRILTHPETGATLSVGHDRYTVPADLKRLLEIRDGTCRYPFSNRPVRQTDLDHTLDWQYHGESAHNNLAHLSRNAHILKHQARWSYTQATDGSGTLTWTTPTGHVYITEPDTPIGAAINDTLRAHARAHATATKQAAAHEEQPADGATTARKAEAEPRTDTDTELDKNPPF
jgi:Domain of unknown function (DUF222)